MEIELSLESAYGDSNVDYSYWNFVIPRDQNLFVESHGRISLKSFDSFG